ncbi:MAG: hypothetical protein IPJ11_14120 [Gemmatimonadetes bacterium]|nr:hypothetical protein [Gemmatimonadota bacterium]
MRRPVLLLLLISILAGSATAQSPRIIDNPRPTWKPGEALALSAAPTLVIGADGGPDYELSRVRGAARLGDGRIVVADGGSLALRFYDAAGRYVKSAGGKGGGPGEFEQLESFWRVRGDTLVAGSLMRGDLSYFTGDGKYLHRLPSTPPPGPPGGASSTGMPFTLVPLDGGGLRVSAMMPMGRQTAGNPRSVDSFPVAVVDRRQVETRRIGALPMMEVALHEGEYGSPWFGAKAAYAVDATRFYVGLGTAYSISVYTRDGTLSHTIRRAWSPRRVTKADVDSYMTEWGKRWIKSKGAQAEKERAELRNDRYATTVPAFSQFIADGTGRLWVREAHLADAPGAGQLNTTPLVPSTWSVFDPAGRWLGDVTMPARFLPRDIGTDYVLGVALDDDNVETVVMYRLAPRAGR